MSASGEVVSLNGDPPDTVALLEDEGTDSASLAEVSEQHATGQRWSSSHKNLLEDFDQTHYGSDGSSGVDPESQGTGKPPLVAKHLAGPCGAFLNYVKANIGSGILAMPYAFLQGGTILGSVSLLVVFGLAYMGIHLLVRTKHAYKGPVKLEEYGDLGEAAFGNNGRWMIDIPLMFTQVGFCCAYLIFIGNTVAELVSPDDPDAQERWHYIFTAAAVPVLIPISWIRRIKLLTPFSAVSNVCFVVSFVVLFYNDFENISTKSIGDTNYADWVKFPIAMGIFTFAIEGIGLVLPIEDSLRNRRHFFPVLLSGFSMVLALVISIGLLGYMSFGSRTKSLILDNLDSSPALATMVKVLLVFALTFTYPLQLWPVIKLTELRLFPVATTTHRVLKQNLWRSGLVVLSAGVAMAIPHFSEFIS